MQFIAFFAILAALSLPASGTNTQTRPNGYFVKNSGKLRNLEGFAADSVLAIGYQPGGVTLFATAHALYFAKARNDSVFRSGVIFPYNMQLRFGKVIHAENQPKYDFLKPNERYSNIFFTDAKETAKIQVSLDSEHLRVSYSSKQPIEPETSILWGDHLDLSVVGGSSSDFVDIDSEYEARYSNDSTRPMPVHFALPLVQDVLMNERAVDILLDFSTFLGGKDSDSVMCTTTIDDGILIGGSTASNNFPCTPGASSSKLKGNRDGFLAFIDSTGSKKWVTYIGGSGDDCVNACTYNGTNVFISGTTNSPDLASAGSYQDKPKGSTFDAFVAKLAPATGVVLASTFFGGSELDEGRGICALPGGSVAICGTTFSTDLKFSAFQPLLSGSADAFIAVFDNNLTKLEWGSYYGGRADDEGRGVAPLADGSLVLAGNTSSPNSAFRIAENVGQGSTPPGGLQTSGFIVRFNQQGNRVWGRYLGGDAFDTITCIQTAQGNIFIGGFSNSQSGGANNFISSGSAQNSSGSGRGDGFVSKLNSDGNLVWGTYIGGSSDDKVYGVAIAPTSDVIVSGTTNSSDFPLVDSDQRTLAGDYDAFVTYILKNGQSFGHSLIIGGSGYDAAAGASIMSNRTVLVAGSTASASFPVSQASQPAIGGGLDAFVCLFEPLYTVGVESDQSEQFTLQSVPMPVSNTLELSSEAPVTAPSTIRCIGVNGAIVLQKTLTETAQSTTLDLYSLPAGMYTIVWSNSTRTASSCIIKSTP
jgi:hypothetical protein